MARYRRSTAGPPRTEAALQSQIWKRIIEIAPNAWIFHPVGGPYQTPGIPDLLMCIDGLFIAMEIKHAKPGESDDHARSRATSQQRSQIRRINASGGYACVVISVEEAVRAVERAMKKHNKVWGPRAN